MGKQIELKELRNVARIKALAYRSCSYALRKLDKIWPKLTALERLQINTWVCLGMFEKLKVWIHDHPHLDLGEKSVARLREIARDLDIINYSRLSKHRLISAIKKEIEVKV